MNATTIHKPVASPQAVTVQSDFWNATPNADKLFSVRGGIPLSDAFDQLSLLLAASKSAVDDVCTTVSQDAVPQSQWAASHMLEFSYALVQAMHSGLIEHEKR
jgi:hypothetical protein